VNVRRKTDDALHVVAIDLAGGRAVIDLGNVADQADPQLSASASQPLQPLLDQLAARGGRLLIEDSLTYAEPPTFKAPADTDPEQPAVVIGAINGVRPLIAAKAPMLLEIAADGTLVLDGLVISGGALRLPAAADNQNRRLVLRDCTLVPGLTLQPDGAPGTPGAASWSTCSGRSRTAGG